VGADPSDRDAAPLRTPAPARDGQARIGYIPALDGLRGLAVSAVLLFHAGLLTGGWLGVDLFFVLSGFLITTLLLKEHEEQGRIDVVRFWGRRARRLLPALFLLLGLLAALAPGFGDREAVARLRSNALATLAYVANWQALHEHRDYWALFGRAGPLDHAWSLAIEEQFYLVWPLLALLLLRSAPRRRWLRLSTVALAAAAMALTVVYFETGAGTARVYYGSDTRAAAILVGCALAAWMDGVPFQRASPSFPGGLQVLGVLAAAALGCAWIWLDGTSALPYRGGLAACQLLGAAVIAAAVRDARGPLVALLSLRPLVALGVISYGLYLWHWPIYCLLSPARTGWTGAPLTTARIAASVAVAAVSYLLIERPVRGGRFEPRRLLAAGLSAALVLAAALILPEWRASEARTAKAIDARAPRVLIVGDSLALSLREPMSRLTRNLAVRVEALPACAVLASEAVGSESGGRVDTSFCARLQESTWRRALREFEPDLVVIVEGWTGLGERLIDGKWVQACEPAHDSRFAHDLAGAIRELGSDGAMVAITTVALSENRRGDIAQLLPESVRSALTASEKQRLACLNPLRVEVARDLGARLIDLAAYLCPHDECVIELNGARLRPDGLHFTGPGGDHVAAWLADRFEELLADSKRP
jgi:peptidoglycan/LPS O-acetylase OafA/YrhL